MPTRVLHVYRTYVSETQGGLEETIRQICRSTIEHGVESRVLTLGQHARPAILEREEARVYRYPCNLEVASCGISISALRDFRNVARWADLIHYHFPWPFGDVLHFVGGMRKRSLVTYHSDIVRQRGLLALYSPLMHRFLDEVDLIVATSPNYAASSRVLAKYAHKLEIVPIGLDDRTHPGVGAGRIEAMRRRVGEAFFLFIGMLRYYKGLDMLLEAVRGTTLPVVIAGRGPLEGELKRRSARLGLTSVNFIGAVDDHEKVALIKLARAIVFPSSLRSEAFGLTLVEGAVYGKPLISTEIGTGTSYVNADGETGFVVRPGDPARLREAMGRLYRDDALARAMGRAARARYERLFTGRAMGDRYADLYERLMKGTVRRSSGWTPRSHPRPMTYVSRSPSL